MWFVWTMDEMLGYYSTKDLAARSHGLGDGRTKRLRPGLYELLGSMDSRSTRTGIYVSTREVANEEGIPDDEVIRLVNGEPHEAVDQPTWAGNPGAMAPGYQRHTERRTGAE
jgi:hypothetical protein